MRSVASGIVSREVNPKTASRASSGPVRAAEEPHRAPLSLRYAIAPILVLVGLTIVGGSYYTAPLAARVRHHWHPWLRPSGLIGQSAGILAFVFFLFLWLYPIRKRVRGLSFTGSMGRWLDIHVIVGLLVPLLAAVHAAWRFTGLIGLGYAALLLVAASGFYGRYLYVRIPRHKSGVALSLEEVARQREELLDKLAADTGLGRERIDTILSAAPPPAAGLNLPRFLVQLARDDLARRRACRTLLREWRVSSRGEIARRRASLAGVRALARREMGLAQQARLLETTWRAFRHWHALHMPVAILGLGAVTVHVAVVVAVGATWFW